MSAAGNVEKKTIWPNVFSIVTVVQCINTQNQSVDCSEYQVIFFNRKVVLEFFWKLPSTWIDVRLWKNMFLYDLSELTQKEGVHWLHSPVKSKKLEMADRLVSLIHGFHYRQSSVLEYTNNKEITVCCATFQSSGIDYRMQRAGISDRAAAVWNSFW